MSKAQLEGLDDNKLCETIQLAQQIVSERAKTRLEEQVKRNRALMKSAGILEQKRRAKGQA